MCRLQVSSPGLQMLECDFFYIFFPPRLCCPCWKAEYCIFSLSPGILGSILMKFIVMPPKTGCQWVAPHLC